MPPPHIPEGYPSEGYPGEDYEGSGPGDMNDAPGTYQHEDAPDTYDRHDRRPIQSTSGFIPLKVSARHRPAGSNGAIGRSQPPGPIYPKYAGSRSRVNVIVDRAEWKYYRHQKIKIKPNDEPTFLYTFSWKAGVKHEHEAIELLERDVAKYIKPPLKYDHNCVFENKRTGHIWGVDKWLCGMEPGQVEWHYNLSLRDTFGSLEPLQDMWKGESELSRTSEWTRL